MNNTTLSKIVASALPAICLSTQITSDCHAGELLRSIQHEQSKLPNVTHTQVMQNVFKDYDNLNEEVKDTLDILWHNDAGNLLLRKLHKYIKDETQRITILWDACDKKGESNYFRYRDSAVLLNKNKFGDYAAYCDEEIYALPEQLDTVLFHELCHALHNLEGIKNYGEQAFIPKFYKQPGEQEGIKETCDAWENDEEIYTITGWYVNNDGALKFDWLNTNSYMILDALKDKIPPEKIVQRVFHCDYWALDPKYPNAIRERLDELIIPLEKYVDVQETTCYAEERMDMR